MRRWQCVKPAVQKKMLVAFSVINLQVHIFKFNNITIQAGAASRPEDEIVFTLDTFLFMALDLPDRLRDVVKKGRTVYAPLVWRNERYGCCWPRLL